MPPTTSTTDPTAPAVVGTSRTWPAERVLFALAGTMTLLSAVLAALVSPWFLVLTAFALVLDFAVGRMEKRLLVWRPTQSETEQL